VIAYGENVDGKRESPSTSTRCGVTLQVEYVAAPVPQTQGLDKRQALILEVLLDIRDLQAECAWRLSSIEGNRVILFDENAG